MAPIYFQQRPSKDLEKKFMSYLRQLYLDEHSAVVRYLKPRTILTKIKQDKKFKNIGLHRIKRYMGEFNSYTLNRHRHTRVHRNPEIWYSTDEPSA